MTREEREIVESVKSRIQRACNLNDGGKVDESGSELICRGKARLQFSHFNEKWRVDKFEPTEN